MSSSARLKALNPETPVRPDIFGYHDYRAFLSGWLVYLKHTDADFSARLLAAKSGVSPSFLTMILSGKRNLTLKTLLKLLPWLRLQRPEQKYLENLVKLGTVDSPESKVIALEKMSKSTSYQEKNPNEAEFFVYMSHWYYIAIRELADVPDFKPDPVWIQSRLKSKVPLAEIKAALDFLIQHGYLKLGKDGSVNPPKGTLDCQGAVYWPALTEYHKQMFALAMESIQTTKSADRNLDGYTFGLNREQFEAARKILDQAMDQITALQKTGEAKADQVYHLEFAFFPLTKRSGEE